MTTINLTNNTATFELNGIIYTLHTETGRCSKTENGKTKRIGITEYQVAEAEADRLDAEQKLEDALSEAQQNLNRAVMSGDKEEINKASNALAKARAEWDNRHLDAAAENPEVTLEQFVELVQEAEESAKTEEAKEIADLYCRHPEGTDLQKPAVLNQYGCVDCSKCNVQNCVHRDCMRRNPTSEGGLAECPRLKVKAEEPKAKKQRKARKSKDIAYTYYTDDAHTNALFTLTAKQVDFIKHLPDTCFWENGIESVIWVDCLCDEIKGQFAGKPMTVGAMISTLCEKGLGNRATDRRDGRKCTSFALTEMGQAVAIDLGL